MQTKKKTKGYRTASAGQLLELHECRFDLARGARSLRAGAPHRVAEVSHFMLDYMIDIIL